MLYIRRSRRGRVSISSLAVGGLCNPARNHGLEPVIVILLHRINVCISGFCLLNRNCCIILQRESKTRSPSTSCTRQIDRFLWISL